jgi:hypothetical protein
MKKTLLKAGLASLVIAMAAGSYAGKPGDAGGKSNRQGSDNALSPSSMAVVRDAETGELRAATAQEAAAFRNARSASSRQLTRQEKAMVGKVHQLEGGTRSMILDPESLELLSAEKTSSGELETFHGALNPNTELPER